MSLEDIVKSIATTTQIFQETTKASLKSLEQQIAQLTQSVSILETQGKLPSQTEEDSRHTISSITLKDGKFFDDLRLQFEDWEE